MNCLNLKFELLSLNFTQMKKVCFSELLKNLHFRILWFSQYSGEKKTYDLIAVDLTPYQLIKLLKLAKP